MPRRSRRVLYPGVALIVLPLWLCATAAAPGEGGEVAALRQEVKGLKEVVQHLSDRVERLEGRLSARPELGSPTAAPAAAPATQPTPSPGSAATIRDHWHRISHGMTTQEVEALLGRPQRTMKVNANTVWYYTYEDTGSGSIVFAHDGSVIDWQTPPFNTWW
jgi:SmpA / OmlA family